MSAIVALLGRSPRVVGPESAAQMLDAMAARGADRREIWSGRGAVLGVCRHAWERDANGTEPPLLLTTERLVVAADAALYYRADLVRALRARRVEPAGSSAAHLIAAAYDAWGAECGAHLEGDFAFVVWDRLLGRAVLGRDFGGRRTMHLAHVGDGDLIIASTVTGVVAHHAAPRAIDPVVVATAASGLLGGGSVTAYVGVKPVPAGQTLLRHDDGRLTTETRWTPPAFADTVPPTSATLDDAAAELRALLEAAVAERVAPSGVTALWMSGGWDSTAIFGAGRAYLERATGRDPSQELRPVSLSFPPTDHAHEDHYIAAIAERWQTDVTWVVADSVSLFEGVMERAGRRDDPFAHTFEQSQRALARASRGIGARIVLDGFGGDQLFQVSNVALADDLRMGRWLTLARKWRRRRSRGPRAFFSTCVKPLLSARMLATLGAMRGRQVFGALDQEIAPWVRFRSEMAERARPADERRRGEGAAAYETRAMLESEYMPRALGWAFGFGLDEGIEIRAPLYDQRLIAFAATRPTEERYSGRETKILLRRAMRGLLPESVLEPRSIKTGIPSQYLRRQMESGFPALFRTVFPAAKNDAVLGQLGVIDVGELRRSCEQYVRTGEHILGVQLYLTLECELWIRSRLGESE